MFFESPVDVCVALWQPRFILATRRNEMTPTETQTRAERVRLAAELMQAESITSIIAKFDATMARYDALLARQAQVTQELTKCTPGYELRRAYGEAA